jgi:hypothetical protein
MVSDIETTKDVIEVTVWIITALASLAGALSLAYVAYTYHLNKKQLNFSVITSCTERFQRIMGQLKAANEAERKFTVKQYIDLCNEELFYFKHKYLPDEIIDEWIDGMIYYLPHYMGEKNVNESSDYLKEIIEFNLLEDYPKIKKAFKVDRPYNLSEEEDRKDLVNSVKRKLK